MVFGPDRKYYKNISKEMVKEAIDVGGVFEKHYFTKNYFPQDLYFWGIKRVG